MLARCFFRRKHTRQRDGCYAVNDRDDQKERLLQNLLGGCFPDFRHVFLGALLKLFTNLR
jgi:hypothetical protein